MYSVNTDFTTVHPSFICNLTIIRGDCVTPTKVNADVKVGDMHSARMVPSF